MIHGYGSTMDQPWINMDQRGSTAFSLQPSACPPWLTCHGSCVMAHVSCVMAHASCVRLMAHASHASGVRRPASGVRRQASGVMRPASCVPRFKLMAHASCVMAHGSCVMAHGSCVMRHASGVRRQTPRAPIQPPHSAAPFSPFSRRPLSVMTTTKRRHFPHAIPFRFASDLRPLRCMAWGNRVVLPTPYSAMGEIVRIKTGCGAHSNAAACFYSYEKGRHNAGPVPD